MDDIFEGLKENKKTFIIVLVLIGVIIVISILDLIFDNNKKESLDMKGIVKSFAELYYEELYYPSIQSNYGNYVEKLGQDAENGIILTLRQIVNIFDDVDATKFYKKGNYCDFLETYATIYPKYPYRIEDYEIKIKVSCDKEL